MDWTLLGIGPTKDKKEITNAYRAKLRTTNPEDKPEEFKALRAAYEDALKYAQQEDAPRDESPLGLWKEELDALYRDYRRRIDAANWKQLLSRDICMGLDTRPQVEDALIQYLMENYFIPQSVWQVLEDAFGLTQRMDELSERYPREFLEQVVVPGVRMEQSLDYDGFEPGENAAACDEYRKLYFALLRSEPDQRVEMLDRLATLGEFHPLGEALRLRFLADQGSEEAKDDFRKLMEKYPRQVVLHQHWLAMAIEREDWQEKEAAADRILELTPEDPAAMLVRIECIAHRGDLKQAKELSYDLMRRASGDPYIQNRVAENIQTWNLQLIEALEEKYRKDPRDMENLVELAWCYLQNENVDRAFELARKADPKTTDPFDYHNLLGKLYHRRNEFEAACDELTKVADMIRTMEPDGTDKTAKRLTRLPEMLQLCANCRMNLGQIQEARAELEEALSLAPENPDILLTMGKIYFDGGDLERCVETLETLSGLHPENLMARILLAMAHFKLRNDREAFDAVERALYQQSGDLTLYILKMQILLRNNAFDQVKEILEFLRENQAPRDINIEWIEAQLTELADNNPKKAFEQYQALARRLEAGEVMLFGSKLYFHMAVLMSRQSNLNSLEELDILLAVIDKGLDQDKLDDDCLSFKAWVLKRSGKVDDAIAMYRDMLEKGCYLRSVELGLAELYNANLNDYAQEALEYNRNLLKKRTEGSVYFYAARCCMYLRQWQDARDYFGKLLEMDPEDVDALNGLADICNALNEREEALSCQEKAIAAMDGAGQVYHWLLQNKVQTLRRMNQPEKALAFVREMMSRYEYEDGFQLMFDICCQFGLWAKVEALLKEWKQKAPGDPQLMKASGMYYLLVGKMFRATWAMGSAKHRLPAEDVTNFRLDLAELECNVTRQLQIWTERAKSDPTDDHAWLSLAQAMWRAGEKAGAAKAANHALKLLDGILEGYRSEEALYRSRRSLALALVGREEEARSELERTRKLPLCDFCDYCKCKDADIFEAAIEEVLGNKSKALELYKAGREVWPDDLDFAAGIARLSRKGK